jgi:hypothetical protein
MTRVGSSPMSPDELERRLWERLDALGPAPRAELLHVLMLPDFDPADRIGEFWGNPKTRPITWRVNAILLTLATLLLSACDPGEPRTIGVYAEDSAIHIVSPALCPGERIVGVTIYAVREQPQVRRSTDRGWVRTIGDVSYIATIEMSRVR